MLSSYTVALFFHILGVLLFVPGSRQLVLAVAPCGKPAAHARSLPGCGPGPRRYVP